MEGNAVFKMKKKLYFDIINIRLELEWSNNQIY